MQVVAVASMDARSRKVLRETMDLYAYSCVVLPQNKDINPIYFVGRDADGNPAQDSPWRASDATLAIVDLASGEDLHHRPAWQSLVEQLADVPTLYLDESPPKGDPELRAWQKRLLGKLAALHAEAEFGPADSVNTNVWLVIGSTGGPEAFRELVDALPLRPSIGFLYGQHINDGLESNLVSMLDGRRGFSARLGESGARLETGKIFVTPASHQITLLPNGVILSLPDQWQGEFQPSLNGLVSDFSRSGSHLGGIIVLSGMGEDGAAAVRYFMNLGGRVFVQDPSTCVVGSMAEAAIASGAVEFIGSPAALAERLMDDYLDGQGPTVRSTNTIQRQ